MSDEIESINVLRNALRWARKTDATTLDMVRHYAITTLDIAALLNAYDALRTGTDQRPRGSLNDVRGIR
jgi:hypothetical protein